MVLVPERGGAFVARERIRELADVAVGVPAKELRLPPGQVLRRGSPLKVPR